MPEDGVKLRCGPSHSAAAPHAGAAHRSRRRPSLVPPAPFLIPADLEIRCQPGAALGPQGRPRHALRARQQPGLPGAAAAAPACGAAGLERCMHAPAGCAGHWRMPQLLCLHSSSPSMTSVWPLNPSAPCPPRPPRAPVDICVAGGGGLACSGERHARGAGPHFRRAVCRHFPGGLALQLCKGPFALQCCRLVQGLAAPTHPLLAAPPTLCRPGCAWRWDTTPSPKWWPAGCWAAAARRRGMRGATTARCRRCSRAPCCR